MRLDASISHFPKVQRGRSIELNIDGRIVKAYEGETIASALLAEGITTFGHKHKTGRPAGLYCGMGVCYECLVRVNGLVDLRACQTPVTDKMIIETTPRLLS